MTVANELPLIEELLPAPESAAVFQRLASRPHCLFLDSARRDPKLGRYSFVTADPFDFWQAGTDDASVWSRLAERLREFCAPSVADLPPFQGGAAGVFSYELGRSLERLPLPRYEEFQVPGLSLGWYDVVAAFDHQQNRAWLISHGWPERDPQARRERAAGRLREFRAWLTAEPVETAPGENHRDEPRTLLAPQFPISGAQGMGMHDLTSNFTRQQYLRAVEQAIEYIRAGDLFQVNLAQRLLYPARDGAAALYLRLRQRNPAPFAAYFDAGTFQVASASPERFLQVRDGAVETRPIKGTRARTQRPEADDFSAHELKTSEKERAENVMIVDLMRNDLSRICRPDSVRVTQLCQLEVYEYVQHLVSAVRGELRPGCTAVDVLRAAFPGGSVTGAPKIRAMQIIAELESTARGAYCGALAYFGFDGAADANLLIRTITAMHGWWQFPVGGGIVAQSIAAREYEETWYKAEGLLRSLEP